MHICKAKWPHGVVETPGAPGCSANTSSSEATIQERKLTHLLLILLLHGNHSHSACSAPSPVPVPVPTLLLLAQPPAEWMWQEERFEFRKRNKWMRSWRSPSNIFFCPVNRASPTHTVQDQHRGAGKTHTVQHQHRGAAKHTPSRSRNHRITSSLRLRVHPRRGV